MDWKNWIGKKIFVVLNSGQKFTGLVLEVEFMGSIQDNPFYLVSIKDKYGKFASFSTREIAELREA